MGVLRLVGVIVVTFFLTLFLLGAVVSYTATQLTSDDVLKPAVAGVITDLLEEQGIDVDDAYNELVESCDDSGGTALSEALSDEMDGADGIDIELNCAALKSAGADGVMSLFVDTFIEQIDTLMESEDADESFKDAMPLGGLNIFSDQNKEYFGYAMMGFTVLAAICILGLVILSKSFYKALIPVGIAGLFFGIPFGLLFMLEGKLAVIESEAIRGIASSALAIVRTNALIAFVAGAVLLVTGVVLMIVLRARKSGGSKTEAAPKDTTTPKAADVPKEDKPTKKSKKKPAKKK